jgi:DNA-binding NarL/FixJ family response regulator
MAVQSADRSLKIIAADDLDELHSALKAGVDLVLFNRELGWGFEETEGVEVIRQLRKTHPHVKTMLVSNYAEAQAQAVAAGAAPGFGKREIGSPRVGQVIREALAQGAPSSREPEARSA